MLTFILGLCACLLALSITAFAVVFVGLGIYGAIQEFKDNYY